MTPDAAHVITDTLIRLGHSHSYLRAGLPVYRQGETVRDFYLLRDGSVHLAIESLSGRAAVIQRVTDPGSFFGEEALVEANQGAERKCSAITDSPCEIVTIPGVKALLHIRDKPEVAVFVLCALVNRISHHHGNLADLICNKADRRLARAMANLVLDDLTQGNGRNGGRRVRIVIRLPHQQDLANQIGTTRSHVNRFLSKWRECGLIEYDLGVSNEVVLTPAFLAMASEEGLPLTG